MADSASLCSKYNDNDQNDQRSSACQNRFSVIWQSLQLYQNLLEVLRRVPEVLRLVCVFLLADADFERPDALEPDLRLTFVAAFSLSMILIPLCCLYFRYCSLLWRHFQSFPLSFQNFYLLLFHGLSQSLQPLLHQKD